MTTQRFAQSTLAAASHFTHSHAYLCLQYTL